MKLDQLPEGIPEEELLQIFIQAARSNIEAMAAALEEKTSAGAFPDLATLHRVSHNLKGSAYQFGFQELAELALQVEQLAFRLLSSGASLHEDVRAILREAMNEMNAMVEEIVRGEPIHTAKDCCRRLQASGS